MKNQIGPFISILFALLSATSLLAQEHKKTVGRKIMMPGETLQFHSLGESAKVKKDENITFFWVKNNTIHSSQGDYVGGLLHGEFIAYYPNSNLKEKGNFNKGRKDGLWRSWFENGKLKEIYSWKAGYLDGPYQSFDSLGSLNLHGTYKKNKEDGVFTYFYKDVITFRIHYKNGKQITLPAGQSLSSAAKQPFDSTQNKNGALISRIFKKRNDRTKQPQKSKEMDSNAKKRVKDKPVKQIDNKSVQKIGARNVKSRKTKSEEKKADKLE